MNRFLDLPEHFDAPTQTPNSKDIAQPWRDTSQSISSIPCVSQSRANQLYSNILFLPFRKTNNLALSAAIKQHISTKYDQHPDMFKQDLEVIDALRRDAVNVREPHTSGIKKIAAYAGQLSWMGGKFPIDVSYSSRIWIFGTRAYFLGGRLEPISPGTLRWDIIPSDPFPRITSNSNLPMSFITWLHYIPN